MPSQGSVTIDVRAQITGYEASLKQLQNEMSKIDPGSAIGKKLSKEIDAAGNQLKALSKNLSPKATSDTQIDNIIDKANLLGESIQHIARLMQTISAKDLNFDAFGDGISNFRKEIAGLEEDLQTKLSAGIRETISSSDQLKEVFENILNIKIEGKSSEELFQALTEGANKAEEELKELDAKIEETNNKISRRKARQEKLEESSFGTALGRDQLLEETKGFEKEYQSIFDDLRNKVTENLKNVVGDNTSVDQQKLLDSFFGGLTPQNIKEHIKNLYASLESEGIYKDQKTKFYNDIFGFDGNINSVAKQINLEDPQPIIDKFKNFVEQIAEHIGGKNEAVLTELIGKNEVENATAATLVYINQAYNKVQNEIRKKKTEISELTSELNAQTTQRAAVNDTKATIEATNTALEARLKELENDNASLRTEIENLKQQIAAIEQTNVSSVRNAGAKAGLDAGQFRISTDMANQYKDALEQVRAREQLVGKIQGVVQQWFSIYAAIRMVGNAIRSVIATIQELDKTITEIAIVTDMTQEDLWGQMQSYTEMARSYASSIAGVYKVSQLYYQQGLQTADVMALTEQTLKMARISGLDYAEATNYMTNAVRSFKMEMTDAQRVVDVYSAIAAASATDTTELAEAMSKTASSAEAVGSSFENTTAMMAVMIEATRESASNIGSAMKSIISRYGEMTSDPSKLVDSEGQEMSLNKVDKALQSVGISIHDATGQFRNFDEVIMELAESWDTIDKNTQRYIATVMAGNRQQSRFLALVSSYDRLKELSATAADSEDASQLQFLKTLDSVDAKLQQLQTSMQSLYVDSGLEKAYKKLLDLGNNVIKTFTQMPKIFNLPILAITKFGASFFNLAKVVTTAFGLIKARIQHSASELTLINKVAEGERLTESEEAAFRTIINEEKKYKELARVVREGQQNIIAEEKMGSKQREEIAQEEANKALQIAAKQDQGKINKYRTAGMVISSASMIGSLIAGNIDVNQNKNLKGAVTLGSSLASGVGTMLMMGGPTPAGIISGIATALPGIVEAIGQFSETAEERMLKLKQAAEEANNALIQKKADYQNLNDLIKQYEKLEKTQYDSEEARKEFYEVGNQLAEKYPELLQAFDSEGNALIKVADSYLLLADAREKAKEAAYDAANTSTAQTENAVQEAEKNREKAREEILKERAKQKPYSDEEKTYKEFALDMRTWWEVFAYGNNSIVPPEVDVNGIENLLLALQFGHFDGAQKLLDDKKFQTSLNILRESADENLQEIINFIDSYTAGLTSVDADIEKKRTSNKNQERASLAKIIGVSNSEQLDIAHSSGKDSVLEELSGADILISNYIYSKFEEYKKDLQEHPSKRKKDKTILQQFNEEQYETVYAEAYELLKDVYSSIASPEDRKKVEEIIKNRSKYTQDQLVAAINNIIGPEGFNGLIPAINELYTGVFDETKFKEAIKGMEDTLSITTFDPSLFGSSELQKIFEVYKNIYQGIKDGQFDSNIGQEILNNYLGILSYTNTLDETSRELAQNLLLNADIFTLNGIYDLKQAVSESNLPQDIINLILNSLISSIPINLSTEFSAFTQENVKKLEDFDKALSSAAKGMELDDAIKMADKLKVSINEFDFKNGKYFYSNAEKIKESYLKYNQELLDDLDERFIEATAEYTKKINETEEPDERTKLEAELEEIKESHARASEKITEYTEYQVNTFLLQNGFIEEFVKSVAGKDADIESLIKQVLNGNISNLPHEFDKYIGEIYNLLNNVNEEIFSSILNSIKSGKYITSNATNRDKLEQLKEKGILEKVGEAAGEIIYKVAAGVTESKLIDVMGGSVDVESRIKAHNQEFSNTVPSLLSSIINSLDKIDYSTVEYLKEKLNLTDKDIQQYFKYDEQTGNYSTTLSNIQRLILDERLEFSEAVSKIFEDDFAKIADYYIDSISKASGYTTKGTTKFADITDFTQIYNELNKSEIDFASSDLFVWNDLLDAFTLKPEYLNDYLELQKQQLEQLGYSSEWAEGYINSQIKQIRNSIDFNSFISAENNAAGSKARKTLENQLTNYLSLEDPEYQKKLAEINFKKAEREHQKEFWSSINTDSETLAWLLGVYDSNIARLEADLEQSEEAIATRVQEDIDILSKGGTAAIDILKKYKPEATAKEIEAAYRTAIVPLEDAQAQLEYGVGSLVSGVAVDILGAAGYKIDDNGVIESIGDLNRAYSIYYQALKDTNGATIAAINAAYAKVLETSDGEQVVIDALGDAANMTYTRLGEILASAGKRLDDEFSNISQYIESVGGNKIRITDFAGFADYMGWEANSEEYWSAFKTYNDAMVDLNRKAERNITEELQNALNAQPGDWVNLTQLTSKIPELLLNQIISGTDAVIEDGILKLDEGASTNIAEIVNRILDITSSSGLLLDNEVNELKDAIQNLLDTYINLFKNGISGSLSSTDAGKLQNWASTLDPNLKLDFTRTAEGLKLSNQSATELYQTLKSVDSLRANLLFNDLAESLQKSDDRFSSISRTMGTIANLENQIKSARGGNTAELEKQLSLAQEIARVQAADPSSYDFMNRSLPDAFKGPQNYWDSIGEMFKSINTSAKDGYMGIQDFYNIVNEMNNLAALGTDIDFMGHTLNGSLKSAASLIEAGFNALTNIDGEGVKIDLSRFGVDFASGADQMNANVQKGIREMAQSQIDMLDALINLLEAIVAMEDLGNLEDIDSIEGFSIGDIFQLDENEQATDKFQKQVVDWSKKLEGVLESNEHLKELYNSISIDGHTLYEYINDATDGIKNMEISSEQFFAVLDALRQIATSNDYDNVGDVIGSIQKILAQSGLNFDITMPDGKVTISSGFVLEMDSEGKWKTITGRYDTKEQAMKALLLEQTKGIENVKLNEETKQIEGTLTIGNEKITATVENNEVVYSYGEETYTSKEALLNTIFNNLNNKDDYKDQYWWEAHIGIRDVKITELNYENINEEIRQALETAVNNGDVAEVQRLIKINPILSSFKGSSFDDVAQIVKNSKPPKFNADTTEAEAAIDGAKEKAEDYVNYINTTKPVLETDTKNAQSSLSAVRNEATRARQAILSASGLHVTVDASQAVSAANEVAAAWQQAASTISSAANTMSSASQNGANAVKSTIQITPMATGNVALAGGTRQTLMGELGPELYVANGHYYIAGQHGAEFVDLPDNAIVFNHLQTERLLKNGSAGRGKAVTNERKATSLATGNTSGPAMASASAALAALKQIRAMWDAMLNAGISDLGSKAGLGKGGGGGGNKDKGQVVKLDAGYIRDLERWYNLLRQIDRLEQDINYEEKLRAKLQADTVANGKAIYGSQRKTYDMLQREIDDRVELAGLKKGYYEQRMAEIQAGPWGQLFYFNEEGVPQMKNLDFLANVFASSEEGGAVHNAREQYAMLQQAGFGQLLQYKEDGSIIEWTDDEGKPREEAYKEAVEAFSAKLDAQTEEVNSLREDYIEEMGTILELQTQQNEILKEIRENTIAVEQEVLKALEAARQAEIDELQKQRDALGESTDRFINGLNDQMNKEREMYNQQESDRELTQLYRQLGILQRSGASATQIRTVQEKIAQKEQDAYFEAQQKQIDAIKEASDLQLERLDAQISLMTETLEYQKAHGLLWDQVHQIMALTQEEIQEFITTNNPEWWEKSFTQRQADLVELDNKIQQWVAHRDDITTLGETMKGAIQNGIAAITSVVAQVSASQQYTVSGTGSYVLPSSSSSSGGNGGSSNAGSSKKSSAKKSTAATNATKQQEHKYIVSYIPLGSNSMVTVSYSSLSAAQEAVERFNKLGFRSVSMVQQYKEGGLIDYTGPAWVDGTKKKPEGILSAEQLDMLRNSVLTRKNPVAALLADYGNTVSNTANANTYNSIDRSGDTIIENAQVVMNVSKLSNDYDAKQAGRTALEEMLRISRKTKPTSVSRR